MLKLKYCLIETNIGMVVDIDPQIMVVVCGICLWKNVYSNLKTDDIFEVAAPLESHAKVGKLKSITFKHKFKKIQTNKQIKSEILHGGSLI